MNEKLKELARQAGFNDFPNDVNGVWITDGYWEEELERFAELVRDDERGKLAEHYLVILEQLKKDEHEINKELVEALEGVTAHLVGAHELIQTGGKKAAPSNTMFAMILKDYEKSIEVGLAALAKARRTE